VVLLTIPETMAGRIESDGLPYSVEDLADLAGLPESGVSSALDYLDELRLIHREGDCWVITDYQDRQETPEARRQRRYREARDNDRDSNVTVTQQSHNSHGQSDGGVTTEAEAEAEAEEEGERGTLPQTPSHDGADEEQKKTTPLYPEAFERFWSVYPKKVGKREALKAWKQTRKERPQTDELVDRVERLAATDDWQEQGGRYVPNPATWLRRGGWDDEIPVRRRKQRSSLSEEWHRQNPDVDADAVNGVL
jgi:hypothetical protein